jgi:hypothetical protein
VAFNALNQYFLRAVGGWGRKQIYINAFCEMPVGDPSIICGPLSTAADATGGRVMTR